MCEPLNEMPIVTYNAHKRPDVSVGLWRRTGNDGGNILLRRFNSILAHMVSQIDKFCSKQITFSRLKFETMLKEVVKHNAHPLEVFLQSLRVNYDIISVDEAIC